MTSKPTVTPDHQSDGVKNLCVMVLSMCGYSLQNRWMILHHNCRTMSGLRKRLQAGLKAGDWIEWRIMRVIAKGKL